MIGKSGHKFQLFLLRNTLYFKVLKKSFQKLKKNLQFSEKKM